MARHRSPHEILEDAHQKLHSGKPLTASERRALLSPKERLQKISDEMQRKSKPLFARAREFDKQAAALRLRVNGRSQA